MDFLLVGKIVKTIGLKGEVKVYPSSDFRNERFKKGNKLFLYKDKIEDAIEITISKRRNVGTMDILTFDGIDTIEKAEELIGMNIAVKKDRNFLKKDSFFYDDLIGLKASFDNGEYIGVIKNVEDYNTYKTLRISSENNHDVLVPFLKHFISNVNLEEKTITIKYMKGLI